MYISKLLSKSCCPHLHKMHKALLHTSSLPSLDATLANTTSTEQKLKQQIPLFASVANQKSGCAEVMVIFQAKYFYWFPSFTHAWQLIMNAAPLSLINKSICSHALFWIMTIPLPSSFHSLLSNVPLRTLFSSVGIVVPSFSIEWYRTAVLLMELLFLHTTLVHPLLRHTAEVVLQEASCHR